MKLNGWTLVALAALAAVSSAQVGYARRTDTVRAGVVLLDGQRRAGVPANYFPYVWYNLDQNKTAKPAGMQFANPRAASVATQAISARWNAIASIVGGPGVALGERLTKRYGAYWEVSIANTSEEQISDYDALYLAFDQDAQLSTFERERLRKFVDQGGVLWVEVMPGGTGNSPTNGLPIPIRLRPVVPSTYGLDLTHPLTRSPNRISPTEFQALGQGSGLAALPFTLAEAGWDVLTASMATIGADSTKLRTVVSDASGTLGVAGLGDGFVVVSTRGESWSLNRGTIGGGAPGANAQSIAAEPIRDAFANAAAKLALNLIGLRSASGSVSGGSQKVSSTAVEVGAPLLRSFIAPATTASNEYRPPAVYKGLLVVTSGNRVYVFDANPSSDVDGDGDPDDGTRDFAQGRGYDLLWASDTAPGQLSAPTVAEVGNSAVRDQVLVTTANGTLLAYDLYNFGPDGRVRENASPIYQVSPPGGAATGAEPYAPTVHEGIAFIADTTGTSNKVARVWMVDLATGTNVRTLSEWVCGGPGTNLIREAGGAPTVGYIPIRDNSGGLDRVVYVPTKPRQGGSGPSATAGMTSIWVGTRGESPSDWSVRDVGSNKELVVTTRAALQGLPVHRPTAPDSLGVKLTLLRPNGEPYTAAEMANILTGTVTQASGTLIFGVKGTAVIPPDTGVRVDYTIDWGTGNPGVTNQLVRGQLYFPDDADLQRVVQPSIALAPNGNLFVVTGSPDKHGSLFAIREEGRGTFELLYKWDLYPEHTIRLNQARPFTNRETLIDEDGVSALVGPFLTGKLTNFSFRSGPAVSGDTVYVIASARKNIFIDIAVVLAFDANPLPREIQVGQIPDRFSIVQPDIARSPDKGDPRTFNSFQMNQFRYEGNATVRFDNLMTTNRGPITNALSTSQPIIIRRAGAPDQVVEPGEAGGRWDPLRWYMVMNGYRNFSPPFVTGGVLYMAGDSMIPSLFENGFSGPPTRRDGLLFGLYAKFSPNDAFLIPNSVKPWMKQATTLKVIGPGQVEPNPNLLWPQYRGNTSFEDFVIRFNQTLLKGSNDGLGVVGGEGGVYAWTSAGTYGFRKADFIVADEKRVGRYDPIGNPEMIVDKTYQAGEAGENAATNRVDLVRPTRAYPIGANELLIVDTGANRILRVDATGREIRSLNSFRVDPAHVPDGFQANGPTTFSRPRDVVAYSTYEASPSGVSNPRPLELWQRYVVADSGNHRIVEIADRYEVDPVSRTVIGPIALGTLVWHTPAPFSGKRFEYTSVSRAYVEDALGGRYVVAAGISNARPTYADFGFAAPAGVREEASGNGGVVLFDGANSQVIGDLLLPAIPAGAFYVEGQGFVSDPRASRVKTLQNLNSATIRMSYVGGNPVLTLLIADGSGVYEAMQAAPGVWAVSWMLPREAYLALRRDGSGNPLNVNPRDFNPVFARRLDSGDVLIVNGYAGRTRGDDRFLGEVLQIDGDAYNLTAPNLGFRLSSIMFELPPIQGARGLSNPIFADRR